MKKLRVRKRSHTEFCGDPKLLEKATLDLNFSQKATLELIVLLH